MNFESLLPPSLHTNRPLVGHISLVRVRDLCLYKGMEKPALSKGSAASKRNLCYDMNPKEVLYYNEVLYYDEVF